MGLLGDWVKSVIFGKPKVSDSVDSINNVEEKEIEKPIEVRQEEIKPKTVEEKPIAVGKPQDIGVVIEENDVKTLEKIGRMVLKANVLNLDISNIRNEVFDIINKCCVNMIVNNVDTDLGLKMKMQYTSEYGYGDEICVHINGTGRTLLINVYSMADDIAGRVINDLSTDGIGQIPKLMEEGLVIIGVGNLELGPTSMFTLNNNTRCEAVKGISNAIRVINKIDHNLKRKLVNEFTTRNVSVTVDDVLLEIRKYRYRND